MAFRPLGQLPPWLGVLHVSFRGYFASCAQSHRGESRALRMAPQPPISALLTQDDAEGGRGEQIRAAELGALHVQFIVEAVGCGDNPLVP